MREQAVRVECYSGYKGDQRPVRIVFEQQMLDIAEVEDRWYSPGATYFRVRVADGDRYVLRRDEGQDSWSLTAFRSAIGGDSAVEWPGAITGAQPSKNRT